jgi:hypothetical protein
VNEDREKSASWGSRNAPRRVILASHLIFTGYSAADIGRVRGNLLQYCMVDTLAMVRVHEVLVGMGQQ